MRRIIFTALLTTLLGLGAGAPTALAATVSLKQGVLSYRAKPGERNFPVIGLTRPPVQRSVAVIENGPPNELVAGAGCIVVRDTDDSNDEHSNLIIGILEYDAPENAGVVRCPLASGAGRPRLRAALGDGGDQTFVDPRLRGYVDGGSGPDSLDGAALLLDGGSGDDQILLEGEGGWPVRGSARGGPGNDELTISAGGKAGASLDGGPGNDILAGGDGRDILRGGSGDDEIYDFGQVGNVFYPGPGHDKVSGSSGRDTFFARDGDFDELECARGVDTVVLDALDFYEDHETDGSCERVRRRGLARAVPLEATAYLRGDDEVGVGANRLAVLVACPEDGRRTCAATLTVSDRRGTVLHKPFGTDGRGKVLDAFKLPRRTLLRLASWARITVVSYDRRGGRHRHSLAGPNIVGVYNPDPNDCPYSKC